MKFPAAEWHSHAAAGYQIWYFIITLRKRRGINPVSSCPARLRRAGRSAYPEPAEGVRKAGLKIPAEIPASAAKLS